jgi:shikimate kinase / 3-dehydroquinate synthase
MAVNALGRHVALVGFMGAGKTTLAPEVGKRLDRRVVDLDEGATALIDDLGIDAFREAEEQRTVEALWGERPSVYALGGGAVLSRSVQEALAERALTVLLDVDADTAWQRVAGSDRPLAVDEAEFRSLWATRQPSYHRVADAIATDADGVVLAAAGVHHEPGSLDRLGELVPGDGAVSLVGDETVLGLYGDEARTALGDRLVSTHALPAGEQAKRLTVVERLWETLPLDRSGTVVALGGGTTTDAAGFAAATYLRGVAWVAVPTTLVGQVDAAIGGKTGIDTANGKNLAGAFHWPARVVIDELVLDTLPDRELRNGQTELLKTELLAGRALGPRAAAAYKAALCLRDPYDRGPRRWLNLGHTFGHALEAAADFDLPHGEAVALGLLAALELSGRDTALVREALDPQPARVDRDRAWEALQQDKKRSGAQINLVLLGSEGPTVEPRPADQVRAALDSLIDD